MGARPSSFKKGGGRLNGVDGVITGYEFTTEFPFKGDGPVKRSSDFNSLWFVLSVRVDGADEDILEPIWAGNADNFEIENDGLTLVPAEEGYELGLNTDFGRFLSSLCDNGFPETSLPEDEINYEAIVGTRCRFIQVAQVGKDGKTVKRVVKKGKYKGKEFDQTSTQVSNVLGLPGTSKANGSGKAAKAAPASKGKPNGKVKAVEADDTTAELAAETIKEILGNTDDGALPKSKLQFKIRQAFGPKHPQREMRDDVLKLAFDDNFLAGVDGISYDASDKSQTISLA